MYDLTGKLQFHYVLRVSIHVFRFTRDSNSHTLKEHAMSLGSRGQLVDMYCSIGLCIHGTVNW